MGTDFPIDGLRPGESVHRELELLVSLGGASPAEALRMATLDSARILGLDGLLGGATPGRIADFVLLRENPLEKISNLRTVVAVIHRGVLRRPE